LKNLAEERRDLKKNIKNAPKDVKNKVDITTNTAIG